MTAETIRAEILRYLRRRLLHDGPRYTTMGRMMREMRLSIDYELMKVLVDDLEFGGFITVRGYGKGLFQISARGVDWVDAGNAELAIESSRWTGRRRKITLTPRRVDQLIEELGRIEFRLSELPITNAEKSQARAFVLAAKLLAESPEPPGELIWEMLKRASEIATIAALFVSVFAILKVQS
jgi:hypothetical protein